MKTLDTENGNFGSGVFRLKRSTKKRKAVDITLDKKGSTEALIKVKVIESDYQSKVEEKIKDYSKKASIKGFRPGKVPQGLVKKMYGTSILVDEVNHILSHKLQDYIKDNNLKIVGDPIPDYDRSQTIDWNNQTEFEFDYKIGLVDDFTYDLKKLSLTKYETEIDEKLLETTLNDLKEQHSNIVYPEVSEEGDIVKGVLVEIDGEYTTTGSIKIDELLKKEASKFTGVKVGDLIKFVPEKAFKKDADQSLLFGDVEPESKDREFQLEITEITRREEAELNQELFNKIFGKDEVSDLEGFKEKIKETISSNYDSHSQYLLDKEVKDSLIESTKIELPEAFLKEWLALSNESITKEDIEKEFPLYAEDLRWNLIQNKIAEDEKIEVKNEEVILKTKDMIAQQFGGGEIPAQLADSMDVFADNYLKGENGNNYLKIYNQLRGEKIFELAKSSAKIKSEKMDAEEFRNKN